MKKEYPIAIKLFMIFLIIFDTFIFFKGIVSNKIILSIYSFFLFPCLFNSWEASEENKEFALPIFLFIDLILISSFLLCLLSLFYNRIFLFWCFMTMISILYMMWNFVYLKSVKLSNHTRRNTIFFNKIWMFSIILNFLFIILYQTQEIPNKDFWTLILFFPWLVTMYLWYKDKVFNTYKINFSDMKVKCYTFDIKEPETIIKKIEFTAEGKIKKIVKKRQTHNDNIDYYLLPGFIDSHTHLADSPYTLIDAKDFLNEDFDKTLNRVKKNLNEALDVGITSMKDFGSVGFKNIHIFNKLKNNLGKSLPRVFTSGCYFSDQNKGHFMDRGGIILKTKEDATRLLEYLTLKMNSSFGSKYVKFMLGVTDEDHQCYKDNFFEIANVFKRAKFKVSVHAYRLEDVLLCFKENNGKFESCVDVIEHIGDYVDTSVEGNVIELIKQTGVIITSTYFTSIDGINIPDPTHSVSSDTNNEILVEWHQNVKKLIPLLVKNGVKVALGTDCGLFGTPCNSLIKEINCISNLIETEDATNSVYETLRLMYENSAEALGMEHHIGKIKEEYYCDFVLYARDPLKDKKILEQPTAVFISGRKVR